MGWQHWTMIVLFIVSVALPLIGGFRLYLAASKQSREYENAAAQPGQDVPTLGQFDKMMKEMHQQRVQGPQLALRDFIFIGIGVTSGGIASIWAVIDSVL